MTMPKSVRLAALVAAACAAACGPLHPCFANCTQPLPPAFVPEPATPPTIVVLRPTAPWTDTGITVHKGDRLFVTATGEVFWPARNRRTRPDGENGRPGWSVGPGGILGKIGSDEKPFDVGARTGLFPDKHPRPPHHPYPPPPLEMPRDGTLHLGFKDYVAGANTGMFDVTIRPAVPAPSQH